ncbi:hypothetical protein HDV00_001822 [Rhizophlyctis rosea]|nr:hypothetical protein HDV00_001822 [Rhizophlyctis rosea]
MDKPQSPSELVSNTPSELPLELHLAIGKLTDPKTIRNLRYTNKKHRALINDTDFGHAWILELYVSELDKEMLGRMLKVAAKKGLEDIVRAVLKEGGIGERDLGGALERASKEGHVEIVKLLLGAGPYGRSHEDVLKVLVKADGGLPVGRSIGFLEEAAEEGHIEVAKVLLDHCAGQYIDFSSADWQAAMDAAVDHGRVSIAQLLMQREFTEQHKSQQERGTTLEG